jgi:hypothetical protein
MGGILLISGEVVSESLSDKVKRLLKETTIVYRKIS